VRVVRVLTTALLISVSGAALAQSGSDGDPDGAPGYTNSIFHSSSVDSVNLYNGSLTIPIAIGPRYPIGPKLKFQALLTYSSRIGEGANAGNFSGPVTLRTGDPALGLGWIFTLGAIKTCSAGSNSGYYCYLAPDGSQHQFFETSIGSGYYKTQDASQFYLYRTGASTDPTSFDMWDGDGNHYIFSQKVGTPVLNPDRYDDDAQAFVSDFGRGRDGWYLTTLKDPFGNAMTVSYWPSGAPCLVDLLGSTCGGIDQSANPMKCPSVSKTWIPKQIVLPTATININHDPDTNLISSVSFPTLSGVAATSSFEYDTLDYTFTNCSINSVHPKETIRYLRTINLPFDAARTSDAHLSYSFSYGAACSGDLITGMVLPNGGAIDYRWGSWAFFHGRQKTSRCDLTAPRPGFPIQVSAPFLCPPQGGVSQFPAGNDCQVSPEGFLDYVTGVAARIERPSGTSCDLNTACAAWTTYTQYSFPFGESGLNSSACDTNTSCSQSLTIVLFPPDHDLKQRAKATLFWTGPRDPTSGPLVGDRVGADTEERDFDSDPNVTGPSGQACGAGSHDYPFCASHAARVVRRTFAYDIAGFSGSAGPPPTNGGGETGNRRLTTETRFYSGTKPDLTCSGCALHTTEFANGASDTWEGNGRHFSVETHSGSLGSDTRRVLTTWAPVASNNGGTTVWFPNLWSTRIETDDLTNPPAATRSVYRYADYDHSTSANGFLRGAIVWDTGVPGDPSQPPRVWGECYYRRAPGAGADDPSGNLLSRYSGIFLWSTTPPDPQQCTLSLPTPGSWYLEAGKTFATTYTYQSGLRLTASDVGSAWQKYRVARDAFTGWVTSSFDPAGLETKYSYDLLGRLIEVTPPGEDKTSITYPFAATVAKRNSGTGLLGTVSEYDYDGFGRTIRERRRTPGDVYVKRFTKFDRRGNSYFSSEWVTEGGSDLEDPTQWGTTQAITCPAGGGTYASAKPLNAPGTFRACFDPFGRPQLVVGPSHSSLVSVNRADTRFVTPTPLSYYSDTTEATTTSCINGVITSGTCSQGTDSTTTTLKDAFGNVTQVTEPGGDITTYGYDITSKLSSVAQGTQIRTFTYDRWGFLRNETTPERGFQSYSYGAAGNVLTETFGNPATLTLTRGYDLNGRLKTVSSDEGGGRTYVTNVYDETGGSFVNTAGKLTTATSTNFVLSTSTTVKDVLNYGGLGGRLSQKVTTITGGNVLTTTQSWGYNTLGLVSSHSHPRASGTSSATFGFDAGMPISETVDGTQIVSAVSYQPGGSLKTLKAGVGTALVTTTISPDGYLSRPSRIATNGATINLDTGVYSYDGAGNIRSIGSDSFGYDTRSRLTSANVWDATGVFAHPEGFSYDRWGNVTDRQVEDQVFWVPVSSATNQLNGTDDHYLRGNVIQNGVSHFEFDALSRQTRFWVSGTADEHYIYDAAGERMGKVNPPQALPLPGAPFYSLTACRLVDTRVTGGPIAGGATRTVGAVGNCGIPSGAKALFANVSSTDATTSGYMRLFAAGSALPAVATTATKAGYPRATQAIISVDGPDAGSFSIYGDYTAGNSSNAIIDVFGYFLPPPSLPPVSDDFFTIRDAESRLTTDYEVNGGTTTLQKDYYYFGNQLVATKEPVNGWRFYASDHLGTPRLVTDSNATTVLRSKYLPSGAPMGTGITTGPAFAGMERDAASGNHYDHARFYGYWAMRFQSPDSVGGKADNPQTWNRYAYARNNPLKFVDPNGLEVKYANQHLQRLFTRLATTSPMVRTTLNRYTGEGKPDLFITRGDVPSDKGGGRAYGNFKADQPEVNFKATYDMSNLKDFAVWPDTGKFLTGVTLLSATITLDKSLPEGSSAESNVAVHELGHADFAARDALKYFTLGADDMETKNGAIVPHDDRPLEEDAIKYRNQACGVDKNCPSFR
jgi:RHS repeat-associated protein